MQWRSKFLKNNKNKCTQIIPIFYFNFSKQTCWNCLKIAFNCNQNIGMEYYYCKNNRYRLWQLEMTGTDLHLYKTSYLSSKAYSAYRWPLFCSIFFYSLYKFILHFAIYFRRSIFWFSVWLCRFPFIRYIFDGVAIHLRHLIYLFMLNLYM